MRSVFTARKRSLGQGNIFINVCSGGRRRVSDPGGCLLPGGVCSGGMSAPGDVCSGWVSAPGGLIQGFQGCLFPGSVPGRDPPTRWILLQVVCILLECILVLHCVTFDLSTKTAPAELHTSKDNNCRSVIAPVSLICMSTHEASATRWLSKPPTHIWASCHLGNLLSGHCHGPL